MNVCKLAKETFREMQSKTLFNKNEQVKIIENALLKAHRQGQEDLVLKAKERFGV